MSSSGSDSVKIRSSRAAAVCLVLLCVLLLTAVIVLCPHPYKEHKLQRRDTPATNQDHQPHRRERPLIAELVVFTDGWLHSNFSFYFISSLKKTLNESKIYCMERGADLIIINDREEQAYIFSNMVSRGNEFWIGLTDSDEEGRWKWVDGSTLTSGFWGSGEPNGQRGENCVVSYPSGWYDYPCNDAFRWICENKIF
uniref:C-type lectin domain-containing protein n=1 Tax=Sinocyclocheilus rhinocerous TaxID=307959 RepID=A0A673JZG1_9TELE